MPKSPYGDGLSLLTLFDAAQEPPGGSARNLQLQDRG